MCFGLSRTTKLIEDSKSGIRDKCWSDPLVGRCPAGCPVGCPAVVRIRTYSMTVTVPPFSLSPPFFSESGDQISETFGPPEAKILGILALFKGETLKSMPILGVRRGRP